MTYLMFEVHVYLCDFIYLFLPLLKLFQAYAFRALRFLFSMERNRHHFKSLFPAELFELFIDIGHYNRDISTYEVLVSKVNSLSVSLHSLYFHQYYNI